MSSFYRLFTIVSFILIYTCLVTAQYHAIPNLLPSSEHAIESPVINSSLDRRGSKETREENRCGAGIGICAQGFGCSGSVCMANPIQENNADTTCQGWCGKDKNYTKAPECQLDYGPGCDANVSPIGSSTSSIARTKLGRVAYGGLGIYKCTVPNVVAVTYDDGPSEHTNTILDLFEKYNGKTTFFITGNGKGRGQIDDPSTPWPAIVRRIYNSGHQIGSHTWTHEDQSKITAKQRKDQMIFNEMALGNVLGVFPTYMRPPYSSCNSGCEKLMENLGYHITYFDADTEDTVDTVSIKPAKDALSSFGNSLGSEDRRLVIGHDTQEYTAKALTESMLRTIKEKGMTAVTVGECLGDPQSNWYRTTSGAPYSPPAAWRAYTPPKEESNPELPFKEPPLPEESLVSSPPRDSSLKDPTNTFSLKRRSTSSLKNGALPTSMTSSTALGDSKPSISAASPGYTTPTGYPMPMPSPSAKAASLVQASSANSFMNPRNSGFYSYVKLVSASVVIRTIASFVKRR